MRTGWETFLEATISAGFTVSGTWPMQTELTNRMVGLGTNALASSIVLVCRRRDVCMPTTSRRQLIAEYRTKLPRAVRLLQSGNIAPVDLAQAAIGPGMEIYSRYAKVLDAAGAVVSVRQALALINQVLDEVLAEQEGDYDSDSRWAITWFEEYGFKEGEYGRAEILSKAKNTSVEGLVAAGIAESKRGKVRLWRPSELRSDWEPMEDTRLTTWEIVHHLIRVLETNGEEEAGKLVFQVRSSAERIRELCYRLYLICDRKKLPSEARAYNSLIQSWPEITRLAKVVEAFESS